MLEIRGIVVLDARRQNMLLPGGRRQFQSLQLLESLARRRRGRAACVPGATCCQAEQKLHELRRRNRLDFFAHAAQGQAMNARQQHAVAPLDSRRLAALRR